MCWCSSFWGIQEKSIRLEGSMFFSYSRVHVLLMEEILHQLIAYPIIYGVWYIPGAAGFQPSTVVHPPALNDIESLMYLSVPKERVFWKKKHVSGKLSTWKFPEMMSPQHLLLFMKGNVNYHNTLLELPEMSYTANWRNGQHKPVP